MAGTTVARVDAEIAYTSLELAALLKDPKKRSQRILHAREAMANIDRLLTTLHPYCHEYFELACARNRLGLLLEELKVPAEADLTTTHAW